MYQKTDKKARIEDKTQRPLKLKLAIKAGIALPFISQKSLEMLPDPNQM